MDLQALSGASLPSPLGTEVGALLVDGLGDGALIECPGEDLEFLRLMTFGMLQVWPSSDLSDAA